MELWFDFDAELCVYTCRMRDVAIDGAASIESWRQLMEAECLAASAVQNGKFDLMIDLDGISIDPSAMRDYAASAKSYTERFFRSVIRYNSPEGLYTETAIRSGALRNNYPSNIFANREEALKALAHLRSAAA